MTASRCLLVVRPPGPLDPAGFRAFGGGPDQGISCRPGVWHHQLGARDCEIESIEGPRLAISE